jgi:hypothetical protein
VLSSYSASAAAAAAAAGGKKANDEGERDDESLVLLDVLSGLPLREEGLARGGGTKTPPASTRSPLSAAALLGKAGVRRPRSIGGKGGAGGGAASRVVGARRLDGDRIGVWVAWSTSSTAAADGSSSAVSTLSSMAFVELAVRPSSSSPPPGKGGNVAPLVGTYRVVRASPLTMSSSIAKSETVWVDPFLLSSLRTVARGGGRVSILSVSSDRSRVILATMDVPTCAIVRGRAVEIDFLHPYFRRITSITVEEVEDGGGGADGGAYHVVRVAGADERWGFVLH